uniref:Imidazole glycerol phosphate synthase subunit HisH n=1 Tax=Gronococcus sybilensis TaxID=3028029 RepID=A0A9Y1I2N4_9RHOD|nr:imidazole glycerol phosphate synthase subunit hisH [Gronococcus sybilensis]
MKYIGIIDYQMGNLHSVYKAVEKAGGLPKIITCAKDFSKASMLILPGVGSFDLAVDKLKELKLIVPIQSWIKAGKPFLGICLGLQLLFEKSEEGKKQGLSILKGTIIKLNSTYVYNIPHMGWNQLHTTPYAISDLNSLSNKWVYFVHSYYVIPKDLYIESTFIKYGQLNILSSIHYRNILGLQFHPEKSGYSGLLILRQALSYYNCL